MKTAPLGALRCTIDRSTAQLRPVHLCDERMASAVSLTNAAYYPA